MNINIDDIDSFNKHFVEPLITAMEAKIEAKLTPLVDQSSANTKAIGLLNDRTKKLEGNQAKALVGWTVFVMGVTLLGTAVKNWAMAHLAPPGR